jgi:GDPmannose 4,6-dehydratase
MSRRQTVVTGALGQDGFILCRQLRTRGIEVVGIIRPGQEQSERRRVLEDEFDCRLVELDLRDTPALEAFIAGTKPDRVFHLAAAHHASYGEAEPVESWQAMTAVNFAVPDAIARALVNAGVDCSLVYASSSQIWTAQAPEQRVDEATPVNPTTFYGHTKVWASDLLRQYRHRYALRASIAILFNHESPWRSPAFVTRMITMAAAKAARGDLTPLKLKNIGASTDWQPASEVVDALILMADAPAAEDYLLASGRCRSVKEFAAEAYKCVGLDWRDPVIGERDQPGPSLAGAPAKAVSRLGWRQDEDFARLVREMVDADVARLAGSRFD